VAQLLRGHADSHARNIETLDLVERRALRRAIAIAAGAIAAIGIVCGWDWRVRAHPRIATNLTWQSDIRPLFARHCDACHTATTTIPLTTYPDARPWMRAIREEVLERRMPPARGRPGIDDGVDDHPLSPMERDLIIAWIDGGMPEGRAGIAPAATFWCRMHPDVRADRAGTCPQCGMPLTEFIPDLTRRYGWSFERLTRSRSTDRLTFSIAEHTTRTRVRDLEVQHEHPLHLFIVSEDFASFEHVHPTLAGGEADTWTVPWHPKTHGAYRLYADFLPIGGAPQMLQRRIVIGRNGPPASVPAAPVVDRVIATSAEADLEGTLATSSLRAGDTHRVTFTIRDTKTQRPVTDLEPYLGAWGHLFALHEGRDEALHAHPDSTDTNAGGPTIAFDILFPRAGAYYLWVQVRHHGTIATLPFVIHVPPRA
jgi:Heavy metal binding domain